MKSALRYGVPLLVLIAVLPLLLADPNATDLDARLLPMFAPGHPLGTDALGRDLLARLSYGTALSLLVAFAGVAVAATVGSLLGTVAAFAGRWLDFSLMRGIDVLMAFPYLLLALALVAAFGPGLLNATLAIAIVNVPFFARTVRGAALEIVEHEYVAWARASGAGTPRVLLRHVLPNLMPTLVVAASTNVGWVLLETAGLSFLGLGAQPPTADLGGMLGRSRYLLVTAPHVVLLPGAVMFALVLGLNLGGDRLRDALDAKSREG